MAQPLTLTGDGRRVRVACNRGCVLVVGNGADVRVERNEGTLRVVGNGGRVRVLSNAPGGSVHYVGDGGCVRVGGDGGRVDYAGAGGHVERRVPHDAPPCACHAHAPGHAPTPVVQVAHRPHARAAFREVPLRANGPATAVTINVASAADAQRCAARLAHGFWIAT